jgi:hypothetical protein
MSGEGRQDGDHAKVAHPVQDFVLQRQLPVDPGLRQGAAPALRVAHPRPAINTDALL